MNEIVDKLPRDAQSHAFEFSGFDSENLIK